MSQLKQQINLNRCPMYKCPIFANKDYMWEDYEDCMYTDDDFYLEESDFYPPPDNRVWKSLIEDIDGGDNFADYCKDLFKLLDEEEYWEN